MDVLPWHNPYWQVICVPQSLFSEQGIPLVFDSASPETPTVQPLSQTASADAIRRFTVHLLRSALLSVAPPDN
jgi:hypothetical protein